MNFLDIFFRFFKISALTFGGGYAMMPMVEKELVDKDSLLTHDQVLDDYALGQTIPGVIGANSAALMGYRIYGRIGLIFAVLGFISPSIIIITIISMAIDNFSNNSYLQYIFIGLKSGVLALMINSLINISKKSVKGIISYIILFVTIIGVLFFNLHPLFLICGGGLFTLVTGIINKEYLC
ncbi:MAG: chromate transporter [Spirochaetales bacterium]|nr:chromate transporter [Spirochaetales bacterium]